MIRSQGDWRADDLEKALEKIRSLIPLNYDGKADTYDGSANQLILNIIKATRNVYP